MLCPPDTSGQDRPLEIGVFEQGREQVALEVIDAHEGHVPAERVRLRGRQADQQRTDETGTTRDRDRLNRRTVRVESGVGERARHDRSEGGHVGTAGQFRDDAAKGPMLVDRGLDHR